MLFKFENKKFFFLNLIISFLCSIKLRKIVKFYLYGNFIGIYLEFYKYL